MFGDWIPPAKINCLHSTTRAGLALWLTLGLTGIAEREGLGTVAADHLNAARSLTHVAERLTPGAKAFDQCGAENTRLILSPSDYQILIVAQGP